ncbi:serine/threonine protein kinase, partial [Staphylococcus aureus]|nr:serine/threonine protein kinase [Staphylococcus aureus]
RYQSVREMQNDLETVMSDERASEDRYQSSITNTKTVPINKSEIANQTREEDKGKSISETMQIPIVNQQQFQSSEEHIYA